MPRVDRVILTYSFAQGRLTVTNGSVETVQLPAGMIFTGKDGIEAITDSPVYVPAGSADGFGMSTVPAHLVAAGINMPRLDIDQVVGTSLYVRNLYPFTGGKPAYSVKVVTTHDKQAALSAAKVSVSAQRARVAAKLAKPCYRVGLVEGVGAAELDVPVYKVSSLTGDADYCHPFERQEFLSRCYVHPNANTAMGEIKGRP